MKPGGGSRKGSAYERFVATRLSTWWTMGERDDVFWRTHSSGARATQRAKRGKTTNSQLCDICSTDPMGIEFTSQFVVECKSYKTLRLWNIYLNRTSKFKVWWAELLGIATAASRRPLLIMRENRQPELCAMDLETFTRMESILPPDTPVIKCSVIDNKIVLIPFDALLKIDVSYFKIAFNRSPEP